MQQLKDKMIDGIRKWFNDDSGKADGVILGISGGKDSTVCAALLCEAIGKEKVFALLMPNGLNESDPDYKDGIDICKYFGIEHKTINIAESLKSFIATSEKCECKYTQPAVNNLPPRIRMMYLYMIGQSMNYRVIGTSNKSELTVGWFTKWGDNACDFNLLSGLTKTDVVEMGKVLNIPHKWIDKAPADGITGKTDEQNFGFTYEQLDEYIKTGKKVENYDQIKTKEAFASHKIMMKKLEEYLK